MIVGQSPAMERVRSTVLKYGQSDAPVLIQGETGTGKELVAESLHAVNSRRRFPFVAVNCASLGPALFESELFGSERGAFTSADRSREGLVRRAHRGTLFLDEVGELALDAQPRLLRLLEGGRYRRVGANAESVADLRVVAATNRQLATAVARGGFRADLYYRLSVLTIQVPPLRERKEDIPALVAHFLGALAAPQRHVGAEAMAQLTAWDWPGNVRELKHTVERTHLAAGTGAIRHFELGPALDRDPPPVPGRETGRPPGDLRIPSTREEYHARKRIEILRLLNDEAWNISATARRLGLSRGALRSRMRTLGLDGLRRS